MRLGIVFMLHCHRLIAGSHTAQEYHPSHAKRRMAEMVRAAQASPTTVPAPPPFLILELLSLMSDFKFHS